MYVQISFSIIFHEALKQARMDSFKYLLNVLILIIVLNIISILNILESIKILTNVLRKFDAILSMLNSFDTCRFFFSLLIAILIFNTSFF